MSDTIELLDHGFVRLVDKSGRDITLRMARVTERANKLKPLFLEHLEACGDKRNACKMTPVSVNTVRGWTKQDEVFRGRVNESLALWRGENGVRKCKTCLEVKPTGCFSDRSDRPQQRTTCKECKARIGRESYARNKANAFFRHKASRTKSRSKSIKVECNIDPAYLESIWTGVCPVLGCRFDKDFPRDHEHYPELDRIVPSKGYVKGNVAWLSRRANRLKNNVGIEEIKLLSAWLEGVLGGAS